jgi:hypothetical protein
MTFLSVQYHNIQRKLTQLLFCIEEVPNLNLSLGKGHRGSVFIIFFGPLIKMQRLYHKLRHDCYFHILSYCCLLIFFPFDGVYIYIYTHTSLNKPKIDE